MGGWAVERGFGARGAYGAISTADVDATTSLGKNEVEGEEEGSVGSEANRLAETSVLRCWNLRFLGFVAEVGAVEARV